MSYPTYSNMKTIQAKLISMNVHLTSLRNLNRLRKFVNRLKGGHSIEEGAFDTNIVESMYRTYSDELLLFDVDKKLTEVNRYVGLLRFLTKLEDDFERVFENTVNKTPGLKVYLLTHAAFNVDDTNSTDWFTQYMIDYLHPTADDIEYYESMYPDYKEVLSGVGVSGDKIKLLEPLNPESVNPYDDDIILKFGVWNRNVDGRITDPIYTIDSLEFPSTVVRDSDLIKLIEGQGILDMNTGELVMQS